MRIDRPIASRYADYREAAADGMRASRDADVRAAGGRLSARGTGSSWISTPDAIVIVKKRLTAINTATPEAAELRRSLANLDAMLYVEKSSHAGEHRVPGAEKTKVSPGVIRDTNELQAILEGEMRSAGATKDNANSMAFVMAWAAFGKSLDDLIRDHPHVFVSMPHQRRLVGQWLDRAKRLRSGK